MANFGSFSDLNSLFNKIKTSLSKRPKTWTGTRAEWDAMTTAQKAEYDGWYINFTDDYSPVAGGGHVIQNQSGTDMEQEVKMQFKDAHVTDDSTNGKTKVEVVKEVTLSQFNALSTDGSADGMYKIGDGQGGSGIEASDIEYDNTTSELTADDVQDAIDELAGKVDNGSISVTADGVKTYGEIFNELFTLIDATKISKNCSLVFGGTFFSLNSIGPNNTYFVFTMQSVGSSSIVIRTCTLGNSSSNSSNIGAMFMQMMGQWTFNDISTSAATTGVYTVYY